MQRERKLRLLKNKVEISNEPKKAALVTGGAKRLGREIALELARKGYDIAIQYASSEREALEVTELAKQIGVRSISLRADFLVESETVELIDRARTGLDSDLSVLINNASIFTQDTLVSSTRKNWDDHFETNLRAPYILSKKFALQFIDTIVDNHGEPVAIGNIINLVDQRVLKPTSHFSTYTIAKMGLWNFTRTAAITLAPNIRVNAIGPGPTLATPLQNKNHFKRQRSGTILQRGTNVEDVLQTINFIIQCNSLTGQLLCVDGGQHLSWKSYDIV